MCCYVSLSFDDGRYDNYANAFQILKEHNISGTFHIITGYIDGTSDINDVGSSIQPCSINQLKEMESYGCEISSHSDSHDIIEESINSSFKKIKKWGFKTPVGFSIPHSDERIYSSSFLNNLIKNKKIKYIRTGKNLSKLSFFRKTCYVLYSAIKSKKLFYLYNSINVNNLDTLDIFKLIAIPVKSYDSYEYLNYFLNKYLDKNVWIIFMFHSVISNENFVDKWDYSYDSFNKLCLLLSKLKCEKKIKIDTISSVIDFLKK